MTRRLSIALSLCLAALALTCASAQASGGTVTGWGYNYYGESGNGTPSTNSCACLESPVSIPGLSGISQVEGGYYHSLFLSTDGTVRSVGENEQGQLGLGNATGPEVCDGDPCATHPTVIPGLSGVVAIDASGYSSYALLANGTVMAWGENEEGKLGLGTSTGPEVCDGDPCVTHPTLIPGLSNVVAISASTEADTAFALLADGTVMGWGYNYEGQLGGGVGTYDGCECVDHPVAIPGVSGAIAIAGGDDSAMALLADHSVVAWGESYYGQLGNGDATIYNPTCDCLPATKTLTGVKSIAGGDYHGVAVMLDGSTKTWGYNSSGQLGIGSTTGGTCSCVATPTTVPGFGGAQAATANYYESMVLLSTGTVSGAGYNGYAELGDGTLEERVSPVGNSVTGASAANLRYYGGAAIVGPSQTLSVAFAGAGTGTVQGGGEVSCPTLCTAKYPQGKVVNLTATSTNGGFAGFSGPCTGTATCQAKMDADQTVTATYGVPAGTKITKAKILSPKKKATFSFSAPGAITGYQCKLNRPKPKPKKGKAKKPKKPKFASCKSSKLYKNLKPGKYTFQVRALDVLGADTKPAKRAFKIHPPKKKHKKKH